uniref:Uncharacterized protein n=1 Tax=Alexandrium catenella TaxID=2925 RepID=A0A7S1QL83_ALECA
MAEEEDGALNKLADALEKCVALRNVPDFRLDEPESEAWEALRMAVTSARRAPAVLDLPQSSSDSMAAALELLAKTWHKRKALRGRAVACLSQLLGRDPWLLVAQHRPEVREALAEVLEGQPELQARMDCIVSTPSVASSEPRPRRSSRSAETELVGIHEMLRSGRDTMHGFHWQFPREPLSTKLDTATEAFMAFYDGLNRLTIIRRDAGNGGPAAGPDLGIEPGDWPGVLSFLASMYSCESRTSYRGRVKFVAAKLEELSAGFASAAADAEQGESGARFWSTPANVEAASEEVRQAEVEAEGDNPDNPVAQPEVQGVDRGESARLMELLQGVREGFGKLGILNTLDQELALYAEETRRELRLKSGEAMTLDIEAEQATIRINFIGLFGLTSPRTRLARVTLRHRQYYCIEKDAGGNTVAVALEA